MSKIVLPPNVEEIIANEWLVHFNRKPIDTDLLYGFVLACNEDFTLLNILDSGLFVLDGYCVFRNQDVKTYGVYDDENYFLCEVIKYTGIVPKPQPLISIQSWSDVLASVSKLFPLIVVDREAIDPDVCNIGKLLKIKARSFVIEEINPDAEWDGKTSYKYKDLTMIKFGGRYESTLALVNAKREEESE